MVVEVPDAQRIAEHVGPRAHHLAQGAKQRGASLEPVQTVPVADLKRRTQLVGVHCAQRRRVRAQGPRGIAGEGTAGEEVEARDRQTLGARVSGAAFRLSITPRVLRLPHREARWV